MDWCQGRSSISRDDRLTFPLSVIAPPKSKDVLAQILYLIPADRAAGWGLAKGWSWPGQEGSLPQANRACQRCEIRHYAPVSRGRTSPSGCQGDTLVMAGTIPTPAGPDPAQPRLSNWVHLQVRGGITAPSRLDFRHLLQIKHSVRVPSPFQPLERGTGSLWCYLGGHRGLGELGARAPTLPYAVPLHLGKQISPCCCSLFHLCPARFSHCSPSCSSLSRVGIPAHFGSGRDAQSFTTPPWAMRSKDLLSSGNCFFFQPPAHSSHHSLHSCSEGFTHPLPSPDSQTMPFG